MICDSNCGSEVFGLGNLDYNRTFAISDLHFMSCSIINWERTQFSSVEAHDMHILESLRKWALKAPCDSVLWNLGDFGNIQRLADYKAAIDVPGKNIRTNLILGNHDLAKDIPAFKHYFDEVYEYPVYLSHKLVLSHEPVCCDPFCVCLSGHLHAATLDRENHICVSANDIDYKPFRFNKLHGVFQKLPPRNMKFLWEPYADKYIFKNKNRTDIVMDPMTGKIDLAASRALQKSMRDENWNLLKY